MSAEPMERSGTPYEAYLYSYPHKTAYRAISPAIPLADIWAAEKRDALSLYMHVPFCEQRCGFCNLFTSTGATADGVRAWLDALGRQARVMRGVLGGSGAGGGQGGPGWARFAIGGGTPTFLSAAELEEVLGLAALLGARLPEIPCSVETSPETATPDRLSVLRGHGIDRISMGVQSLVDAENAGIQRRQARQQVEAAVGAMHALGFPTINLDLMYGLPGQTVESWLGSVRDTLALCPTEIYLYPLYVRPLTVLGRRAGQAEDPAWDTKRLEMYRAARDLLRAAGFDQRSMRMFRRRDAGAVAGPVYCCQSDGMVGLGCGARSYTGTVHYASAYATGAKGVRSILDSYIQRTDAAHATADWGCVLDAEDQRRRFVILSLLSEEGVSLPDYAARFGGDPRGDIPELLGIIAAGFAEERGADSGEGGAICLTAAGMERCDQIGPALRSARIIGLMREAPAL